MPESRSDPHEALNQSPPLCGRRSVRHATVPLQEAVAANGGRRRSAGAVGVRPALGQRPRCSSRRRLANENPPRLRAIDAKGAARHRRIPSGLSRLHDREHGGGPARHDLARGRQRRAGAPAEVARAARYYMVAQVENGHMCPITMTRASVAALAGEPGACASADAEDRSRTLTTRLSGPGGTRSAHDARHGHDREAGRHRRARQHARAPSRTAMAIAITGEKWFMSAPMSRRLPGAGAGARAGSPVSSCRASGPTAASTRLHFRKLKDKLGNRSNASSEVEFDNAYALRVGEEGAGIRTIMEMVQLTRLDCAIASAGMMRAALAQALHHCTPSHACSRSSWSTSR